MFIDPSGRSVLYSLPSFQTVRLWCVCVFISCFLAQIHVYHVEDVRHICLLVNFFSSHSLMECLRFEGGQREVLASFTESRS